ncbi:uncharacterized protein LOC133028984 isoform X1 [Cannabis sativa]|uniref:uncharacterized protein LOC133028984 isoform X1 n=1 Tax=Cannabis sativa TaxID=3483 RepID=UPI0029C9E239|nr:uncharacterized protein LOC133028984 isoform X1 [Cannabis sativa]
MKVQMSNREESFEQALNHDPKSKKPKKKRGTTQGKYTLKMKSKGIQQKVTYNRRSQPVGKGAIRYSTYSGALARNEWVPIDLPNWHNADEVKLDMIWKEMKGKESSHIDVSTCYISWHYSTSLAQFCGESNYTRISRT